MKGKKYTPGLLLCTFTTSFYMVSSMSGKMNWILRCDWLPGWARWSYLAHSGLPAVSRMKNFPKSHKISHLLTKLVRSIKDCSVIVHTWSITHIYFTCLPLRTGTPGAGYSRKFWIGVCCEGSWTLTLLRTKWAKTDTLSKAQTFD